MAPCFRKGTLFAAAIVAVGCSSSQVPITGNSFTVSGVADRGPLSSGQVQVTAVNADGTNGAVLATGAVGSDGTFSLSVASTGAFRVTVSGGSYTSEFDGTTQTSAFSLTSLVDSGGALPSTLAVTPLTTFVDSYASQQASSGRALTSAHANANAAVASAYGFPAGTGLETVVPSFASSASGSAALATDVLGGLEAEAKALGLNDRGALVNALAQDVSDGIFNGEASGQSIALGTGTLPATAGTGLFLAGVQSFAAAQSTAIPSLTTATATIQAALPNSSLATGSTTGGGTTTGTGGGTTTATGGTSTGGTSTGGTSTGGGTTGGGGASSAAVVVDSRANRVTVYPGPTGTGESASVVIGQSNSTSSLALTTAAGLSGPVAAVVDSSGNLWVADSTNNRVLEYAAPLTSGMSATVVLGQANLTSGVANEGNTNPAANTLSGPSGVAFDASGNLWVSDGANSRVLEFGAPFSTNMNAKLVLGQPSFTSASTGTTATSLSGPAKISFDQSGNLFVADAANSRVLRFPAPFTTGESANLVIGQTDFVSGGVGNTTASSLNLAQSAVLDATGNLYVGDYSNNRVLIFTAPLTSGMAASTVLGQSDFVSSLPNQGAAAPAANTFHGPADVKLDGSGHLYVADHFNSRALQFTAPFTSNMSSTLVLGQVNATTAASAVTAAGMNQPEGVATSP